MSKIWVCSCGRRTTRPMGGLRWDPIEGCEIWVCIECERNEESGPSLDDEVSVQQEDDGYPD